MTNLFEGHHSGRRIKLSKDAFSRLKEQRAKEMLIKDLIKTYNLSKASIYRLMKEETINK